MVVKWTMKYGSPESKYTVRIDMRKPRGKNQKVYYANVDANGIVQMRKKAYAYLSKRFNDLAEPNIQIYNNTRNPRNDNLIGTVALYGHKDVACWLVPVMMTNKQYILNKDGTLGRRL